MSREIGGRKDECLPVYTSVSNHFLRVLRLFSQSPQGGLTQVGILDMCWNAYDVPSCIRETRYPWS